MNFIQISDIRKRLDAFPEYSDFVLPLALLNYELVRWKEFSKDHIYAKNTEIEMQIQGDKQPTVFGDKVFDGVNTVNFGYTPSEKYTSVSPLEIQNSETQDIPKENESEDAIEDYFVNNEDVEMKDIEENFVADILHSNIENLDTSSQLAIQEHIIVFQIQCPHCLRKHTTSKQKLDFVDSQISSSTIEKYLELFPHEPTCKIYPIFSLLDWSEGELFWFTISGALRRSNNMITCIEFLVKENRKLFSKSIEKNHTSYGISSHICARFFQSISSDEQVKDIINTQLDSFVQNIMKEAMGTYFSGLLTESEIRMLFILSIFGWKCPSEQTMAKSQLKCASCHLCGTSNRFNSLFESLDKYNKNFQHEYVSSENDSTVEQLESDLIEIITQLVYENHRIWCPMSRRVVVENSSPRYAWELVFLQLYRHQCESKTYQASNLGIDSLYYNYTLSASQYIHASISDITNHRQQIQKKARKACERLFQASVEIPITNVEEEIITPSIEQPAAQTEQISDTQGDKTLSSESDVTSELNQYPEENNAQISNLPQETVEPTKDDSTIILQSSHLPTLDTQTDPQVSEPSKSFRKKIRRDIPVVPSKESTTPPEEQVLPKLISDNLKGKSRSLSPKKHTKGPKRDKSEKYSKSKSHGSKNQVKKSQKTKKLHRPSFNKR